MYLAQMIGVLSHILQKCKEEELFKKMSLRNMIFEPFIGNVLLLEAGLDHFHTE